MVLFLRKKKASSLLDDRVIGCSRLHGSSRIRVDYASGKAKYIANTTANEEKIKKITNYTEYDPKTKRRIWY